MNILEIKALPIREVVDRLGLPYTGGPQEFTIVENGKPTSGWRFNTVKNISTDFSKDRPHGNNFWLVKETYSLSDVDTYKRFEDNFGTKTDTKPSILQVRKGLPDLSQEQIQYLAKRYIDYLLVSHCVKDYNGAIGCIVYDNEIPSGVTARKIISVDKSDRFTAIHGYPCNGIYRDKIDTNNKKLYVVEGLIDFLTLRQVTSNVIGLKSAESGYKEVLRYYKEGYEIFVVMDNDEAGQKITKQLNGISFKLFNPGTVSPDCKDTNDMACMLEGVDLLLPVIEEHAEYVTPIDGIFDELYKEQEIIEKQGKLGFDGPFPFYDTNCSGVVPGRMYVIGAFSSTGKSKFAYYHTQRFLKQGHKVCFITLEDGRTDVLREIIFSYDNISMYEWKGGYKAKRESFGNLIIRDDLYQLKAIVEYVQSIDSDIVFIDYVQNIQASGGSKYEINSNIAIELQRLATSTNKAIYALSQVSNEQKKIGYEDGINLKGAGEYFASAHYVFGLSWDDLQKQLELKIHKTKGGPKGDVTHCFKVDYARNQFDYIIPRTF